MKFVGDAHVLGTSNPQLQSVPGHDDVGEEADIPQFRLHNLPGEFLRVALIEPWGLIPLRPIAERALGPIPERARVILQ